jgi:hypothetical protein
MARQSHRKSWAWRRKSATMAGGSAWPCLSRFLGSYLGELGRCGSQGVLREWSRGATSEFGRSAARGRRPRAATRIRRCPVAATKRLSAIAATCSDASARRTAAWAAAHAAAPRIGGGAHSQCSPASRPAGAAAAAWCGRAAAVAGCATAPAGRPITDIPAPRPHRGAAAGTAGPSFASDLRAAARLRGGNCAGAGNVAGRTATADA